MKTILKTITLHQLNECKITPMEYIEFNKFINRMTNEQVNKVANAIQSRYPKAVSNIQIKIDTLEQARVNNPSLTFKINKKIARLRAIQNKYRVKQQVWMIKGNSKK